MKYRIDSFPDPIIFREILPAFDSGIMADNWGNVASGNTISTASGKTYQLNIVDWARLYSAAFLHEKGDGNGPLQDMCDELEVRAQRTPNIGPKKGKSL